MDKVKVSDKLLLSVEKPARYTGGELNSIVKETARLRFALNIAISDEYVEHGNVNILYQEVGIDAESVVKRIIAEYVGLK